MLSFHRFLYPLGHFGFIAVTFFVSFPLMQVMVDFCDNTATVVLGSGELVGVGEEETPTFVADVGLEDGETTLLAFSSSEFKKSRLRFEASQIALLSLIILFELLC